MIDGRNIFDKPKKNDLKTYDNIDIEPSQSQGGEVITQLDVQKIIFISKNNIN